MDLRFSSKMNRMVNGTYCIYTISNMSVLYEIEKNIYKGYLGSRIKSDLHF